MSPVSSLSCRDILKDTEQELISNDTSLPNGLRRLREDRSPNKDANNAKMVNHLEIARFSTESLHSYNFVSSDVSMYENRQNILRRSIDFMKSKIKGWKFLDVHQVLLSLVEPATGTSTDIVLPQEETGTDDLRSPRRPRGTLGSFSDIPALYQPINTPSTLHSPTRFTPQNQAIITTDNHGNILNANDIACLIFSYSRTEISTIKAFDLIASPYREKQEKSLALRPQNNHDNGEAVLACGKVIPIQRKNEETSAASLWLKAKKDDGGNSIFIWIFEEIVESMMIVEIDDKGIIHNSSGDVKALYGYSPEEIIGMCVTTLIPALEVIPSDENNNDMDIDNESSNKRLDIEQINNTKYYGSRSKNCAKFPIIGKISMQSVQEGMLDQRSIIYRLKIISMPTIAGVITAHATGIIQSCNSVFVKYLFGVGSQELVGKRYIESLLPQFPRLIGVLASERSLVEGVLISENAFRRAATSISSSTDKIIYSHTKDFSSTTSVQGPSGIIAVHRDGTEFDVDIQMRVVESPDEPLHALWITYDRSVNFAKEQTYLDHVENHGERLETSRSLEDEKIQEEKENFHISKFIAAGGRPPLSTHLSSDRQIITPPVMSPAPEPFDPMSYSAITLEKTINDFEILDNLGQGAYGQVKLAYNKNDIEKKRVVLKYVVKSRILVDCWTRDKVLGTIPLEIHILHTLRRFPHPNIVQMVDFFEDDDYYYIEMGLHGAGMDLFDYIELNTTMAEDEIKLIFRQVARAIQHLHHRNIVHRDIKDENVILDEDGIVQLIDFGSSAYIKTGKKYDTFCGTIDYAAPEVLTGKKYDGPPQDIWALGILLYTLIYKENPFYNIDEIIARDLRIPYILSDGSIDLVKKMLDRDVDKRPSIDDVLNHQWLWEE
ncbi:16396_t:CDS:2 [Cetraspora pellucida]|uniref:non-specific serine/threonine protein kinase n=1 Tax=Cetraspora pellucida TaxID=1433469 RepID=A0A9N9C4W2_9GLOM|nr:16396_t:CDS:2 [Cetraspora pellucida]